MARHIGAQVKAFGVSNALRAKKFSRSKGLTKGNKNYRPSYRMSAGFQVAQIDEGSVSVKHFLGNNHGISDTAERAEIVEKALIGYALALEGPYRVEYKGDGEQAYLVVRDPVNPVIGETLRKAAELVSEQRLSGAQAVKQLLGWADLNDKGEDW